MHVFSACMLCCVLGPGVATARKHTNQPPLRASSTSSLQHDPDALLMGRMETEQRARVDDVERGCTPRSGNQRQRAARDVVDAASTTTLLSTTSIASYGYEDVIEWTPTPAPPRAPFGDCPLPAAKQPFASQVYSPPSFPPIQALHRPRHCSSTTPPHTDLFAPVHAPLLAA